MKPLIIERRTMLRGIGVALPLPFLEAMLRRPAHAAVPKRRFVAMAFPNGTSPGKWHPQGSGPLLQANLTPCLQDLAGFAAETEWPSAAPAMADVTLVSGINHSSSGVHNPAMTLSAHGGSVPTQPTLDQYIADRLGTGMPFRSISASAETPGTIALERHFISFRANRQPETVYRQPAKLFETLFAGRAPGMAPAPSGGASAPPPSFRGSILDWVRDDARRLTARLGVADRKRVDQYLTSISELEKQIAGAPAPAAAGAGNCLAPKAPPPLTPQKPVMAVGLPQDGQQVFTSHWNHEAMKQLIDISVLAMACDLTNVVAFQYGSSFNFNWRTQPQLGNGVPTWTDHHISHKLASDGTRDLIGKPDGAAIAEARVVETSRFKVRRFVYLVNALKQYASPSGTLLDETLILAANEIADGPSHSRSNMPIILAGHAGGFRTGRRVTAGGSTGALHASILKYLGIDVSQYGNPAGSAIADL